MLLSQIQLMSMFLYSTVGSVIGGTTRPGLIITIIPFQPALMLDILTIGLTWLGHKALLIDSNC